MTARYVPIAQPSVGDEEWQAIREPLRSGWLTGGPQVRSFEQAFARRHRVSRAVATTSCTTALHLALAALGIGPGDEVIVPAFTWIATANAVLYCGAKPVFVDVRPDTFNIDTDLIREAMTPRTRAVIPVHLFGLCADVNALRAEVGSSVFVVEDAACASGAALGDVPAGGLGKVACFSFHPRKSITTGEGGMLTTSDGDLADHAERLRNHGATEPKRPHDGEPLPYVMPDFDDLGYNYRMTDVQAAMGIVQLAKLDAFIAERDACAQWYSSHLAELAWLRVPTVPSGFRHAWQAYVTVVEEGAPLIRDELMMRLQQRGVETRPGTHSVPTVSYYRKHLRVDPSRYPVSMSLQERSMAIPLHNRMTSDDYSYVVESILDSIRF